MFTQTTSKFDTRLSNLLMLMFFLMLMFLGIFGLALHGSAASPPPPPPPPSYSVSIGSGSFSPNPICGGMTATATVTGTLNVQNPSTEIQESGDSWGWTANVTGYAPSSTAAYTSVPSGITPPAVGASSGSASSNVTATADQTTSPGYYQVTVTGTDNFNLTDSSTDPATVTSTSRSNSTTLYVTVAKVDILWNGSVVTNAVIKTVVVGQGVQLRALVQPSDLLPTPTPNGQCTWTVAGAVYGYTAVNSSSQCVGVVINLNSSNPNGLSSVAPHFYWVKGGNQNISLQVSGVPETVETTFVVQRPNGANVSAAAGVVTFAGDDSGSSINDGYAIMGHGGMEWHFTIDSTYSGKWQYIQLVQDTARISTEANGQIWSFQGPFSSPVLDTLLPYTDVPDPQTGFTQADSPSFPVSPLILSPAYPPTNPVQVLHDVVKANVTDNFKDWLMFQPSGSDSIPVPIGTFTWSWTGSVSRQFTPPNTYSVWSPNYGSTAGKSTPGKYADEQSTFPQWNANITQGYFAIQK